MEDECLCISGVFVCRECRVEISEAIRSGEIEAVRPS